MRRRLRRVFGLRARKRPTPPPGPPLPWADEGLDGALKRASVQAIADLVARGEVQPGQAPALFAVHAQHLFGLTTAEFLCRYDAGEFAAPSEQCKVTSLELLMPYVRPVPVW